MEHARTFLRVICCGLSPARLRRCSSVRHLQAPAPQSHAPRSYQCPVVLRQRKRSASLVALP